MRRLLCEKQRRLERAPMNSNCNRLPIIMDCVIYKYATAESINDWRLGCGVVLIKKSRELRDFSQIVVMKIKFIYFLYASTQS